MAAKTIEQIILENKWKSSSFKDSTDVNRLFNSGIVSNASSQAEDMINAIDEQNVQSTMTVGLIDMPWVEANIGDASDDVVSSIESVYDEARVKTFYMNQWWGVRNIEKDLMNSNEPNRLVLEHVGRFWATQYNKIISATVSGMADIAAITFGDGLENLNEKLVIQARKSRGDMGWGKLARMHMNSVTLADILDKQVDGTITRELIVEKYGTVTQVIDGITQVVQSDTHEYMYKGVTPVVVDDTLTDGIISLIDNGAFAHSVKDLTSPLTYLNSPKAGNGAGKEEWGTKGLFIMHPVGFDFKGVQGTDFASKGGLTLAELQGGGLYDLVDDPKFARILNLRVKVGA